MFSCPWHGHLTILSLFISRVNRETHNNVTIFFSDIVRFTDISRVLAPVKVMSMLDRLYLKFDALANKHEIFKVETIGDAWMGVTNRKYYQLVAISFLQDLYLTQPFLFL